jgi:predicted ribosomally synthesized peptide with SipW-like signal peptide
MKNIKKTLLIVVAMMLASAISVVATFAYLYDGSEVVRNTFTIGKVELSLDEAKVNEYGELLDVDGNVWTKASGKDKAPRVMGNEYKLVPARTYVKDPTVRVSEDSEACVLFLVLYIPPELMDVLCLDDGDSKVIDTKYIYDQMRKHGWLPDQGYSAGAGANRDSYHVFVYNHAQAANPGDVINIFDNIAVREDATYDQLQKADLSEIKITVYGFQDEGTEKTDAYVLWDIIVEAFDPFGTKNQSN